MRLKRNQTGFTIIELMIASTVFAVVLILCTIAMLQIGRTYYKGITITRTQESARDIINQVSKEIQYGGGTPAPLNSPGGDNEGYCIGRFRFSYALDRVLVEGTPDTGQNESNHVLVVDETACDGADAQAVAPPPPANPTGRELLGARMRLMAFDITPVSGADDLYRIRIRVVSGDNDLLTSDHTQCALQQGGGHFCAVSELSTVVQKRIR